VRYPISPFERIKLASKAQRGPIGPDQTGHLINTLKISMQRVDTSVFHRMLAYFTKAKSEFIGPPLSTDYDINRLAKAQVFLIQQDLAATFANEDDLKGEIVLPYDDCIFEARINNVRFCWYYLNENSDYLRWGLFAELDSQWVLINERYPHSAKFENFMSKQVHAFLIMLDAGVATTEIIRAPEKLNRKREKVGRVPLYDYHVIKINRISPQPSPSEEPSGQHHRSPRQHYRRGHWRHLPNYKIWIRWQVVGNRDRGFVDKHYQFK